MVRRAHALGVPVFLVNGRVSPSSFRGYRRLTVFTRRIFPLFELLCVQSQRDRERLLELGAPPDRIHVLNSAKYEVADADPEAERQAAAVLRSAGFTPDRQLLLGGSTWPGEEGCLLDAYAALRDKRPSLALVLAPRHAERRAEVIEEIARRRMRHQLRSGLAVDGSPVLEPPDVLVIDTTGELRHYYPHAAVIFIGKSLTSHGGQNIIEPALHGRPIVVGPNMENFPVVMADFRAADAIRQVEGERALPGAIEALLADPSAARQMGENAAELVRKKRGGVRDTVRLIGRCLYGTDTVAP
jgi:3-deoxy-D-manno-octulosonic-acid transferase